jgi:hypothetical protein
LELPNFGLAGFKFGIAVVSKDLIVVYLEEWMLLK